jgi:DNA-binding LacI/PurR family transcriptional regulator
VENARDGGAFSVFAQKLGVSVVTVQKAEAGGNLQKATRARIEARLNEMGR